MSMTRRAVIQATAAVAAASSIMRRSSAQPAARGPQRGDGVFICNEDSNTLAVIDPVTNQVGTTINLTSFDEDARPPFRYVTGGVAPTHAAMVHKPLYHGAIAIHGAAPNPDNTLIATTGRGSSNVYLIDTKTREVIGNEPNPQAKADTNAKVLSSGVLVGREPHEPTFTRNGRELWVTVRGEQRIAIIDVARMREGRPDAVRASVATVNGPAQAWFSADGATALVVSQKAPAVDVFALEPDQQGWSRPRRLKTLDISAQDKFGFTPFLKSSPDGGEFWLSHKLADAVSMISAKDPFEMVELVPLGTQARPNHVEFVENAGGKAIYASLARVDDNGPGGVASSQIAVIDRAAPARQRKVVGAFFSHGREAHGLWVDPDNTRLYVAHEQDELPNTPHAGQTVCSVFDIADPFRPGFVTQIPLGELVLPSGRLRSKKSINLVYVRPGARSQAG